MHKTAMEHAGLFFETYLADRTGLTIAEIGSQDVNGSIRSKCPPLNTYTGIDFVEGKGVDVVLKDPYILPFPDEQFDVCVASSCFEHSEFFWLLFLEMARITKPDGIIYINVPSNGMVHRWPVDCWRFYPDSGIALQNWANRNNLNVGLLESFIGRQRKSLWNDFVAVFIKDVENVCNWPNRIIRRKVDLEGFQFAFFNGRTWEDEDSICPADTPEDQLFRPVKYFRRWLSARLGGFKFRE